jgi:hypothetical protein
MKDFADGLQSLVPFLQDYPLWVKGAVVVWIFLTALVAVSLLFFKHPLPRPPDPSVTAKSPQIAAPNLGTDSSNSAVTPAPNQRGESVARPENKEAVQAPLTLQDYFSSLDKLRDRFLEKEEFTRELQEKRVTWVGYVHSVKGSHQASITLVLAEARNSTNTAFVHFPEEFRTKLYALRTGDKVVISGIYRTGTPSMPDVEADSIRVAL